jgi:cytochrome c peroxidase
MTAGHRSIQYLPLLAFALAGCDDDMFTAEERRIMRELSPLPEVPPDPTNKHADDPAAAHLGHRLFFETEWAGPLEEEPVLDDGGPRRISCASCHGRDAYDDPAGRTVPLGANWNTRNSPPLVNASFYEWGGWAGRFDSQWMPPLTVFEADKVFNSSRLKVAHVVLDRHSEAYETAFDPLDPAIATLPAEGKPPDDDAWKSLSPAERDMVNAVFVNVGKALAAYCRLLVSRDAPFDRFVAGEESAITRSAQRGVKLFIGKAGCITCHSGAHFSDDAFHNLGIPQTGENVPNLDEGRWDARARFLESDFTGAGPFSDDPDAGAEHLAEIQALTMQESIGTFRTKGLRELSLTAPYMHAGQFETLREVVEAYNRGHDAAPVGTKDPRIVPLHLTQAEVTDLVAFLETLTGEGVDAELTEDPTLP